MQVDIVPFLGSVRDLLWPIKLYTKPNLEMGREALFPSSSVGLRVGVYNNGGSSLSSSTQEPKEKTIASPFPI